MSNTRQLLLVAETAAIAVERSKAAVEVAKAELEAAKRAVDEAKVALDEAYAGLEEAGIPRAKARKAIEDIVAALAQIGIEIGSDLVAPASAASASEARQPVQRQPRRKRENTSETVADSNEGEGTAVGSNDALPSPSVVTPIEPTQSNVEVAVLETVIPADGVSDLAEAAAVEAQVSLTQTPTETSVKGEDVKVADAVSEVVRADLNDLEEAGEEIGDADVVEIEDEIPDHVDLFGEEAPAAEVSTEPPAPVAVQPAASPTAEAAPSPGFRRPSFLGRKG